MSSPPTVPPPRPRLATVRPRGLLADFLDSPARRRADGATLIALYVVALLIVPARLVFKGLPLSLTPANVVALTVAACWLYAQFTTTLGVAKGRSAVRTALFLYAIVVLASYGRATFGYLPADELDSADHAAVLVVASVGLALGMCDGVRGADRRDFVLKTVVVAGAFVAIVGILQFAVDFDLTRYLKPPGFRFTSDESGFITERSSFRRVGGTMGHPIEFGVTSAMILPLAVHFGFQARQRAQPQLRWWICAALLGCGLMFSVSRSAILGMAAAGLVLFIGWPTRRRLRALGIGVIFLAMMKVLVPGLLGTFYNLFAYFGSDSSVSYRTHDYEAAGVEIAKHLWLGRGLGTWYAPKYQVFDNQYLHTLLELGVLGLVAFAGVFLCGIYAAIRGRIRSLDPGQRDLGLSLAAGLVVPLVGAATFDLLSFATVAGLAFLLAGAAGSLLRDTRPGRVPPGGLPDAGGQG